jgi:hypothetical protein
MSWLSQLHPIRLFNFYLAVVFIVTTVINIRDYHHLLGIARGLPARWPRLFELLKGHAHIFLTWRTVAPVLASLGLLLVQMFVTQVVDPFADVKLTGALMLEVWPMLPFVVVSAVAMVAVDLYANWGILNINRGEVEKYFDQAEFWLRSWTAPVVRVLSLGYVNPRQMVAAEVRTALVKASDVVNRTLWWTAWQAGCRILCGLSLWLTYWLAPWLHRVMYGG